MLEEREVDVLTLPLTIEVRSLRPERALLSFGDGLSLDLGCLCYRTRVAGRRTGGSRRQKIPLIRLVDPTTLVLRRVDEMRQILEFLSDLVGQAGMRQPTVFCYARSVIDYLEWVDRNGWSGAFENASTAREVFAAFVEHLRQAVNTGALGGDGAARTQNQALALIQHVTGADDFHHGLVLLRYSYTSRVATEPALDTEQGQVLAVCKCLFEGFADLTVQFRPYPFHIQMPACVGAEKNRLWVFPTLRWCMPPHLARVREELKYGYWPYNYAEGRLATVDEIADKYPDSEHPNNHINRSKANEVIRGAAAALQQANADPRNRFRRAGAMVAHNAFFVCFLANTKMNLAEVRTLPWSTQYKVGAERQGFRSIKYRAGGRLVSFEIQAVFLPFFKRFLELREYLLGGQSFSHLFVSASTSGSNIRPTSRGALSTIFGTLKRLYPGVPNIKSRKWRASGSDWLLRNADISTTAALLQNSEATVRQSYAAGSVTLHRSELSNFFEGLEATVLHRGASVPGEVETSVGGCAAIGEPRQSHTAPVKADCKSPEGCLFCDQYKAHADEKDTRKLVSCRYCIRQTAPLATSEEDFQSAVRPILDRISLLLNEIEKHECGLVGRIEQEVEEGELDPYWARKFEMLVDLGVVE